MTVFLCIVVMLVVFAFVWRGHDVRIVLLVASLGIGAMAGQAGAVFRKTAETLADAKFLLPICSAMGFAHVVRDTGCIDALVQVLVRPIERVSRALLPGAAAVPFVVNMAIPSQLSTLASVGPLLVALLARLRASAPQTGAALVFGASIGGALLNPGVAEIVALSALTQVPATVIVTSLAPAVLALFAVGMVALFARRRASDPPLPSFEEAVSSKKDAAAPRVNPYKALLPPLPVFWLLLSHPAIPTHAIMKRVAPPGLEVFTVMLAGSALTIALAASDRARTLRAMFNGMGHAFAQVITTIAVSAGLAKALETAGVLGAFVSLVSNRPMVALIASFLMAFALAAVSGSGTATSVALIAALGPRAAEIGVSPLTLGSVVLFGAETGRTTSPVAAVLLFGGTLVEVSPRQLVQRLALPSLLAGAAGAAICAR